MTDDHDREHRPAAGARRDPAATVADPSGPQAAHSAEAMEAEAGEAGEDSGGRVQASCACGQSWDVPARAWEWVSDSHARAHNKGRDGLSAAGAFTYGRQPEIEAEAG